MKLSQLTKSLLFRRRMGATVKQTEDKIRSMLTNEGKDEITSGGFRVSLKEGSRLEVTKLPSLSIEQMELPLNHSE